MMFEVYRNSQYVQLAGSVAVAIGCLLLYSSRPLYIRMLGLYALVSAVLSIMQEVSSLFFSHAGLNQIGNASVLSEAWLFSLLFYFVTTSDSFKKGILTTTTLYSILYIGALLFSDASYSIIRFGRDFLMIGYSVIYFYYLIKKLPEENLLQFPMFWINTSVIFFFSGTFVLSLVINYIVSVHKDTTGFWAFRNFFSLFILCCIDLCGLA